MGDSRFARQLTLDHDGDRYRTHVSDIWNCPIVPHGGLVTAVATRAMQLELDDPAQRLRTVTSVFADAVQAGPVEIDVTVLRRGRSISQLSATLRNVDAEAGSTVTAVFGADRPGFSFTDVDMPEARPPEECPSFRDIAASYEEGPFHFNFWDHADSRIAKGHARWDDFPPSPTSERIYWYRFDEPPFLDGGELDPLALVTLCDTMPGAVAEKIGSDQPMWLPPSADLTVHVLGEARSEWVLARNRCRWAGDGYASLEIELWDPDGGLVAFGTQIAFFVFPEGPPPS